MRGVGAGRRNGNIFFSAAQECGLFRGGSEIGSRTLVGEAEHIIGFMRFDSEDEQSVLRLLEKHPVVLHGGSVELCQMPKSPPESEEV